MGREIDDQSVLSLHRQYAQGKPIRTIARDLNICPKTVRRYLTGDSSPNPAICHKIAKIHGFQSIDLPRSPSTPDGFITLREASRLIPYEPSPSHLATFTRPTACPRLRAKVVETGEGGAAGRLLVTRTEWVQTWNAERIGPHPAGVAVDWNAAAEVIDPPIPAQLLKQELSRHPGITYKIGQRRCILLDDFRHFVIKRWKGRKHISWPPGFLDAVHSRAAASGARLFVITDDTLATL